MNTAKMATAHRVNYGDYATWPDEQRWELIDGVAYAMMTPSRLHQLTSFEISFQIRAYLQDRRCRVYSAPFDMRLPQSNEADEQIETVVQPDLAIICDPSKFDEKGCRGALDWIIEVLSPSTALKDLDIKHRLYECHGVKEYWLIHPTECWLMVYLLDSTGNYGKPNVYGCAQPTPVDLFPDLAIQWDFLGTEK